MRQRAIPAEWITLLEAFGDESQQKGGSSVLAMSKESSKHLRKRLQELLSSWDHLDNVYAVFSSDGTVITTAHRTSSVGRHGTAAHRLRWTRTKVRVSARKTTH